MPKTSRNNEAPLRIRHCHAAHGTVPTQPRRLIPRTQSDASRPLPQRRLNPVAKRQPSRAKMVRKSLRSREGGYLIAVIGDEDTATGFLLAGVGENASSGSNYFVVDAKETPTQAIEEAFKRFTERDDIAIILINQYVADKIRATISKFNAALPAVLEIPSKEHPYDPSKDSILQRVRGMLGSR